MTAYRGEIRSVLIFQNDSLNESNYQTTIVLPLTTSLINNAKPLRYRINSKDNLKKDSDILIAHIRSIDNIRLIEKISQLSKKEMLEIKELLDEVLLNF